MTGATPGGRTNSAGIGARGADAETAEAAEASVLAIAAGCVTFSTSIFIFCVCDPTLSEVKVAQNRLKSTTQKEDKGKERAETHRRERDWGVCLRPRAQDFFFFFFFASAISICRKTR